MRAEPRSRARRRGRPLSGGARADASLDAIPPPTTTTSTATASMPCLRPRVAVTACRSVSSRHRLAGDPQRHQPQETEQDGLPGAYPLVGEPDVERSAGASKTVDQPNASVGPTTSPFDASSRHAPSNSVDTSADPGAGARPAPILPERARAEPNGTTAVVRSRRGPPIARSERPHRRRAPPPRAGLTAALRSSAIRTFPRDRGRPARRRCSCCQEGGSHVATTKRTPSGASNAPPWVVEPGASLGWARTR